MILLEDKLNELVDLNKKNEQVKDKMEETLMAYENFIEIDRIWSFPKNKI